MSNVFRNVTAILTEDNKKVLKEAIKVCESIAHDCNDLDMFVDASSIFACIYDNYKNGELPTNITIFE